MTELWSRSLQLSVLLGGILPPFSVVIPPALLLGLRRDRNDDGEELES